MVFFFKEYTVKNKKLFLTIQLHCVHFGMFCARTSMHILSIFISELYYLLVIFKDISCLRIQWFKQALIHTQSLKSWIQEQLAFTSLPWGLVWWQQAEILYGADANCRHLRGLGTQCQWGLLRELEELLLAGSFHSSPCASSRGCLSDLMEAGFP